MYRNTQHVVDQIHDAHCRTDPCFVFPDLLDIEGKTSYIFISFSLFKNLCQCCFTEGCRHPQECGNPHPEDRSRSSNGYRPGYTYNISGTDAAAHTDQKSCQLGSSNLCLLFGSQKTDSCLEFFYLHKTKT